MEREVAVSALPGASANWEWAAAVAEFGLALRGSSNAPRANFERVEKRARKLLGDDPDGSRTEFLVLARHAGELSGK